MYVRARAAQDHGSDLLKAPHQVRETTWHNLGYEYPYVPLQWDMVFQHGHRHYLCATTPTPPLPKAAAELTDRILLSRVYMVHACAGGQSSKPAPMDWGTLPKRVC